MIRLSLFVLLALCSSASAIECPTPGQPCKVLFLSPQEEAMLVQERGILATAAEGRKVELDAVSLYFRRRILDAPQGEVKPEPKPGETK